MKKWWTMIISSLLTLTCLMGCSQRGTTHSSENDNSWERIQSSKTLRIGLDDSLPPLGFRDEQNQIVGFDIDVAKAVCETLGITLPPVPIDWSMKFNELDANNVDCLWNGFSYSEARAEKCTLSKPYLNNNQVLVTLKKSGITSLTQMAGKALSLQEQSSAEQALEEKTDFKNSLGQVVTFKENITAFKDIEAGQTDGLLIDSVMAEYYIAQQADPNQYVVIPEPLATEAYVIAFKKGDNALKNQIETALSELKKNGRLAEISKKWFGQDITNYQ